ncbi:hypothetical protein MXB_4951, partial [Myxobolus squamalis]
TKLDLISTHQRAMDTAPLICLQELLCRELREECFVIGSHFSRNFIHGKIFFKFRSECLTRNLFNVNTIVLMENVRFHQTAIVSQFFSKYSFIFDFLPPYSPELNPIEELSSKDYNPTIQGFSSITSLR